VKRLLLALALVALSYPVMEKALELKPGLQGSSRLFSYSYKKLILAFPTLKPVLSDALYIQTSYLVGNDVFDRWKERKFTKEEWKTILHNVRVMTKLDPYYFEPYYFAGSYASWKVRKYPELLEEVNSILEEGRKYVKDWRLPFSIGFNYFYFMGDKEKGARYLKEASQMEGAPDYLKLLVPRLYAQSGKFQLAVIETAQELERTKNKALKRQLERRLKALVALRDLNLALEKFRKVYGRCPSSLEELVERKFIPAIPKDPYGGEFYIKKESCTVWTTSNLRPVTEKTTSPSSQ